MARTVPEATVSVGQWVKRQRVSRRLTLRNVEDACANLAVSICRADMRVSDSTIAALETANRLPEIPKLLAICATLGLDLIEMLERAGLPPAEIMRVAQQNLSQSALTIVLSVSNADRLQAHGRPGPSPEYDLTGFAGPEERADVQQFLRLNPEPHLHAFSTAASV